MGAGSSVEVPGGGTEGYHVLRVRIDYIISLLEYKWIVVVVYFFLFLN